MKLLASYEKPIEAIREETRPYSRAYFEGDAYKPPFYRDFPSHYNVVNDILAMNPTSVLELGGGRGYITRRLEQRGVPAMCIDVSEYCMRTRATSAFQLMDLTCVPYDFDDKAWDLCISKDFLEHIPEDRVHSVIRESMRVSERGFHGITFADHPNARDDSTHRTLKSKEWWEEQFRLIDASYNVTLVDASVWDQKLPLVPTICPRGLVKLNLGSWLDCWHYNWINIDIADITAFAQQWGFNFMRHDVTEGLPFNDDSVDVIVASHLLEHLTREEGEKLVEECYRVLKSGGILRIAVPDAHLVCNRYMYGKIMQYATFNVGVEKAHDDAEALFEMLLAGHKTIYDGVSVVKLLNGCGFVDVHVMQFNKSRSESFNTECFDLHPEVSVYVEGVKSTVVAAGSTVDAETTTTGLMKKYLNGEINDGVITWVGDDE